MTLMVNPLLRETPGKNDSFPHLPFFFWSPWLMMASVTEVVLIPIGNICKIVFKFRLLLCNFLRGEFLYCLLKMLKIHPESTTFQLR